MRFLGGLPLAVGGGAGGLDPAEGNPRAVGHCAGDRGALGAALGPGYGPDRGLPLGHRRPAERVGPARDRAQALLDRPDLKPCFHLGTARGDRRLAELLAPGGLDLAGLRAGLRVRTGAGVRISLRRLLLGQPGPGLGDLGQALLPGPLGRGDRSRQPAGLVPRGAGPAGQGAELARCLGGRSVGLVQPGEGVVQGLPRLLLVLQSRGQLTLGALALAVGLAELARRLPGRGLQAEQALLRRRTTLRPVHAEDVAVTRDHPQRGVGADQGEPGAKVIADKDVAEQGLDGAREFRRRGDQIYCSGNGRCPRPPAAGGSQCPGRASR